jgi:hypothetical protein
MTAGINPFRDEEDENPLSKGLAIRIDRFDQDFIRRRDLPQPVRTAGSNKKRRIVSADVPRE